MPSPSSRFRDAAAYYESRRAGLSQRFLDAVEEALDTIVEAPGIASPCPEVPAELGARRLLVRRFPYAVVFFDLDDRVRVVAVGHGAREPGYWIDRLGPAGGS